ncbi:MAG: PaaI family thioesterase [Thiomonas arsenitoxydans]|uniref:PaaI family thioesterase n=1 Tax=Thiomonas arsenitoxydans (strain DSM 22701 / CIP 110005 / 3As) TaxID=426114 RepID=A0A8I1MXZ7_THIA3|nr:MULTISPECIES: PaaI family thioesterase [Thiomonas]MBN8744047.1 PaaI family thioesterase [Thiomonas arsenitoxydans]ODU96054.1 MAG: phenylacetic acid degradation protein [Thiomonas sp. SCN 64-16]
MTTAPAVLSPAQEAAIRQSFARQGLMAALGVEMVRLGPGRAELRLPHSERISQQQGGFHGGAIGALADVAGGYAAMTLAPEGDEVTTVEYKSNFLAAFAGGELRAYGRVIRAGKRLIITTAEVMHRDEDGAETVCAVMQQTIAPVPKRY